MDLNAKFGTDTDLEAETGITLDFGQGAKVTIHRAGGSNRKFSTVSKRVFKPYRQQINANTLDENLAVKLLATIYAEAVVLDWEGIKDGEELVPFTKANAIAIFVKFPEFFNAIRREAEDAANFRDVEREEDSGNSEPG